MKIEITRDFKHFRKGQILEPPAMLREFLLKSNAAKHYKEVTNTKANAVAKKRNTRKPGRPKKGVNNG